jgi:hypothetical protein
VNSVSPGSILFREGGLLVEAPASRPRGHRRVRQPRAALRPLRPSRGSRGRRRLPRLPARELDQRNVGRRRRVSESGVLTLVGAIPTALVGAMPSLRGVGAMSPFAGRCNACRSSRCEFPSQASALIGSTRRIALGHWTQLQSGMRPAPFGAGSKSEAAQLRYNVHPTVSGKFPQDVSAASVPFTRFHPPRVRSFGCRAPSQQPDGRPFQHAFSTN